ncbi:MAG TPA: hypothetical protein VF585_06300 [Chthoniobacterales bacterium]|jgi:hypothetical protein
MFSLLSNTLKPTIVAALLASFLPFGTLAAEKQKTVIVPAETPKGVWAGWGSSTPPSADVQRPPAPSFELKTVGAGETRSFSGRVEGRKEGERLEVGLISLVGIHWVNEGETSQWQPVAEDGTFTIESAKYPDARKAICVRGPEAPWTFFPYDFAAKEAASNIIIRIPERRVITVTVGSTEEERLEGLKVEPFIDGAVDHQGKPLRRQRLGYHEGRDAAVRLVVGAMPIALYVQCTGKATRYQLIDPTAADHFHFLLTTGGQLEISVRADGTPAANHPVQWINPAAPLSYGRANTDASGNLVVRNVVPGEFSITVNGVEQKIVVGAGEPTKVVFDVKAK